LTMYKILVINPGSTSTKIAFFQGTSEKFSKTINHEQAELAKFPHISAQLNFRQRLIEEFLAEQEIDLAELDAVVGRGGLLKPIPGGTYEVNGKMIEDLKKGLQGEHASNLGGQLAYALTKNTEAKAFIVDPVVVDELSPLARLSGHPDLPRRSIFHALNQKAIARRYAEEKGVKYQQVEVIVTHLGGGISCGLHRAGEVIDVNNALSGEGPFSPNRTGGLPTLDLAELCLAEEETPSEIKAKLLQEGGVVAYLGTNNMIEVEKKAQAGVEEYDLVFRAMAYQVSKEIGSLAAISGENLEAILLTGGIAHSQYFVELIKERVEFLAPVHTYPGEEEMQALAAGAFRVLSGEEAAKVYQ